MSNQSGRWLVSDVRAVLREIKRQGDETRPTAVVFTHALCRGNKLGSSGLHWTENCRSQYSFRLFQSLIVAELLGQWDFAHRGLVSVPVGLATHLS